MHWWSAVGVISICASGMLYLAVAFTFCEATPQPSDACDFFTTVPLQFLGLEMGHFVCGMSSGENSCDCSLDILAVSDVSMSMETALSVAATIVLADSGI